MMQVNSEPITLSGGCQSLAPESTENSLELDSHFHSKCCDVNTIHHRQSFWGGSRHGCSPRESPGVNSSVWPPSPASIRRSKLQLILSSGEGGVDFRSLCHNVWTPGNSKTPSLTSPHIQQLQWSKGMWNSENLPCFFQTPLRAEQDARMSELEGVHRRLTSTGGMGMSRLWSYLGQWNTLFPTNTELAIL